MTSRTRQAGLALFVVLVFLVIIALFSVAAFNSSTANVRVTGNMMVRNEAVSAAQSVIEATISNTLFTSNPVGVAATPYPVDITGDGNADYTVNLAPAPQCYRSEIVKNNVLDIAKVSDRVCMTSSSSGQGSIDSGAGAAGVGDSLCADTEWNVRATVSDARTGANVAIDQGVGVRALITDANNLCKG